jgi:hypothetical protein
MSKAKQEADSTRFLLQFRGKDRRNEVKELCRIWTPFARR